MRAVQDSNDAAFRALRAGDAAQTLDSCQNMIAVHGVLNGVARDENIAVELRHGGIRHNEAVAVVVKNQAAFYFITTRERRRLGTLRRVLGRFLSRRLLFRLSAAEAGSLLTCRKRNMLSGLSCEGGGIGFRARRRAPSSTEILVTFFRFPRNFFRDSGII